MMLGRCFFLLTLIGGGPVTASSSSVSSSALLQDDDGGGNSKYANHKAQQTEEVEVEYEGPRGLRACAAKLPDSCKKATVNFLSVPQANCNVESLYYHKYTPYDDEYWYNASITYGNYGGEQDVVPTPGSDYVWLYQSFLGDREVCQVDYPTVIALGGLKDCAKMISSVKVKITSSNGWSTTATSKKWPYTGFGMDGTGSFITKTLDPGNYTIQVKVLGKKGCSLWEPKQPWKLQVTNEMCANECYSASSYETNGHLYLLVRNQLLWEEANCYAATLPKCCSNKNAHLVTISSEAENNHVNTLPDVSDYYGAWIGLSDKIKEDDFQWVTGEPYSNATAFPYWYNWDPENAWNDTSTDCTITIPELGGKWAEFPCAEWSMPSIMEWDCSP